MNSDDLRLIVAEVSPRPVKLQTRFNE